MLRPVTSNFPIQNDSTLTAYRGPRPVCVGSFSGLPIMKVPPARDHLELRIRVRDLLRVGGKRGRRRLFARQRRRGNGERRQQARDEQRGTPWAMDDT
jgi:hypothetical protein